MTRATLFPDEPQDQKPGTTAMPPPCVATTDVQKHSLHPIPETHHRVGGNLGEAKLSGGVEVEGRGGLGQPV